MSVSPGAKVQTPAAGLRVRQTFGESLPGGTVLEIVAADRRLDLLISSPGKAAFTAPYYESSTTLYRPGSLDDSVLDTVTFPRGIQPYSSVRELFDNVCTICCECLSLPMNDAALLTIWIFSTWVAEAMISPPVLCVNGTTLSQAGNFFRLMQGLCRRALWTAELTRNLPFIIRPTLLVSDLNLTDRDLAFWRSANFSGAVAAGPYGRISRLGGCKVVILAPGQSPSMWGEAAIRLVLPPAAVPELNDAVLDEIKTDFQGKLLAYRIDWLHNRNNFAGACESPANRGLAHCLFACIPGENEIAQMIKPQLEARAQEIRDERSRDPLRVIVESVWMPSHEVAAMSPTEVARRVNGILRSRGIADEYNAWEIGRRLNHLGLKTRSNGKGKVLKFNDETRGRIHKLAREFELALPPVPGCSHCAESK